MPNINSEKGTSLVEVMVAIVILALAILGGFVLFSYGRGQIDVQKNRRAAVQLAAQKLEGLKAGNYDSIQAGETTESISLGDLSYVRSTGAEDLGLYKKITVSVSWEQMNKQQNIGLTTFIGTE